MLRQATRVLLGTMLAFVSPPPKMVRAQEVLDPSRRIDWSNAGIPGGIPARTTKCAALSPGATVEQINAAIASCPNGQVVYLAPGTYNLSSGIDFDNHSGVTLRGAGPNQTKLVFSKSVNCSGMGGNVCVRNSKNDINWGGGPSHLADWTAGYAKGATEITLTDVTGLAVGSAIILDQLDDSDTDPGGVWVCQTDNVCSDESGGGAGREKRAQTQITRVAAINGKTVTISPGLHMPNWRASQSPQAWWANTNINSSGIEDLAIDHTASDERSGIFFFNATNCWVRNVKSVGANRNHVWLYLTAGTVVRDSYFYGTKNAASQSYGVESYTGSDNLVENNIIQHITAPLIDGGSSSGNVVAYNYAVDNYYQVSPGWMMGSNLLHAAGSAMLLHEGNEGAGFEPDDVHGTHNFITVLRNYFIGWETGKSAQTVPINIYAFGRYMNLLGNVLGKAGYHDTYECNISGDGWDTAIYRIGGGTNTAPSDALVKPTLLRWGNYDVVTGAVQWRKDEVPSALGQFANPVPSVESVPPSYYRTGRPPGGPANIPWPPIGPEVSGGDGPGGHAHKNPAHVCFDEAAKDGNGILDFNAANCYALASDTPDASMPDAAHDVPPVAPDAADSARDRAAPDQVIVETRLDARSDGGTDTAVDARNASDGADGGDARSAPADAGDIGMPAPDSASDKDTSLAADARTDGDVPFAEGDAGSDAVKHGDAGRPVATGSTRGCSCAMGARHRLPASALLALAAVFALALARPSRRGAAKQRTGVWWHAQCGSTSRTTDDANHPGRKRPLPDSTGR